mmetsp:Transcript_11402/g.31847  ORF Transcript_11402/g.31847 Transcript_11402/m.31847 type:complete len:87 (-) Transcript_11402:1505-1765(-)
MGAQAFETIGHLDVDNVRWLENCSESLEGNTLTIFMEKYPRRAYFELSNRTLNFACSEPGLLEDVGLHFLSVSSSPLLARSERLQV